MTEPAGDVGARLARIESRLGHVGTAADRARAVANDADVKARCVTDAHNAFAEEVLARLDALEARSTEPEVTIHHGPPPKRGGR